MLKRQRFEILMRLPGRNEEISWSRNNRFLAAKKRQETLMMISTFIMSGGIQPVNGKCIVLCSFTEPEKGRKRDTDNVESAVKYILDALVRCDILKDDSPKNVVSSPTFTHYKGDRSSCEVILIESDSEWVLRDLMKSAEDLLRG